MLITHNMLIEAAPLTLVVFAFTILIIIWMHKKAR